MKKRLSVWWVFPGFVTGLSVLVTGDRFCLVCVGYWQQTFGLCWLLATDFWSVSVTGNRLLVCLCRLLATDFLVCLCWLLATNFWSVGYWQQTFGLFVLLQVMDFGLSVMVAGDRLWLVQVCGCGLYDEDILWHAHLLGP